MTKTQRRDYNRAYQSEMRSRERLGDTIVSRNSRGELQERPATDTKWTGDYIRAYKRDWMRSDRARKAAVKALFDRAHMCSLFERALMFYALPGFLIGLQCGVDMGRSAKKRSNGGSECNQ